MIIKTSIISSAILAAMSLQVQAADLSGGFFADSKADLNLRSYYFNRDKIGQSDAKALSQGVRLNFESGYINNVIGFDASLFSSLKLNGEQGHGGTGLLRSDGDSQKSYTKIGQAYIKAKLGENSELKAGRIVLNTPLLNDSDSRSTPSSTQAVVATTQIQGADLYAIWSDRGSSKTNQSFDKYTDSNGDDYDVKVIGGGYTFGNDLSVSVAHGQADDVLQQSYINLGFPYQISDKVAVKFDVHYYTAESDGMALGHVSSDYDSDLYNLAAQFSYDTSKLTFSYQEVSGDAYQLGWGGDDETGFSTWNSVQRLDFNREDERSWQVRFDHKFQDIKGLSFMTRYTRGDNIKRAQAGDGSEWERNVELKYAFQDIDGLSLRWRNSTVRSSETVDTNENRLMLNYSYAIK